MKIQLSISERYCPDWGVWEGVREVVQNWMDAFADGDEIIHDGRERLTLANAAGELKPEHVSLLGETTKGPSDRGRYGEGLKVGALALLRKGVKVRIVSGGMSWRASLEAGPHGKRVLTFRSRAQSVASPGTVVVLEGLDAARWREFRGRFLFDRRGPVLEDRPGDVFVRDIWVQANSGMTWGYNLKGADVGRDRQVVRSFDLQWAAGKAIVSHLRTGKLSPEKVLHLLESGAPDVQYLYHFVTSADQAALARAWRDSRGEDVVPVSTEAEQRRAEHQGLRSTIADAALAQTVPELHAPLAASDVVSRVRDLDIQEKKNLDAALTLVGPVHEEVEVVTFASETQLGEREGATIRIARKALVDPYSALKVLVEEVAHRDGDDGSHAHKLAVHDLYISIIKRLFGGHPPGGG